MFYPVHSSGSELVAGSSSLPFLDISAYIWTINKLRLQGALQNKSNSLQFSHIIPTLSHKIFQSQSFQHLSSLICFAPYSYSRFDDGYLQHPYFFSTKKNYEAITIRKPQKPRRSQLFFGAEFSHTLLEGSSKIN